MIKIALEYRSSARHSELTKNIHQNFGKVDFEVNQDSFILYVETDVDSILYLLSLSGFRIK